MADWKSRATPVADQSQGSSQSSWKDRATVLPPEVSQTESGARGLAQGLSFGFADELTGGAEALWEAAKGDPRTFGELYRQARDESRKNYEAAQKANPVTYGAGQVAGAIAPALLTAGGSTAATLGGRIAAGALEAGVQGAAQGLGASEADITQGDATGALRDTAIGLGTGAALGGALPLAGAALSKGAEAIGSGLKKGAEKLAVNATGATGRQVEKFADDAGRQLLDRGLVKFGDNAEKIAQRVGSAKDEAIGVLDDTLKTLDNQGVTASVDNVVGALEAKIADLSKAPGNEKLISQLQKEVDNLYMRGESQIPLSVGEQAKRNFQGQVNWMSPELDRKAASHLSNAFKEEVEQAASQANPQMGQAFKEAKQTFGLLKPIEEAAERRALQQNQAPFGGMGDLIAGAVGLSGGIPGAIGTAALRRVAAPRAAASGAIIADSLGEVLKQAPQKLGKFAPVLQKAAARGGNALASTNFVLQQTNPEYRELVMKPISGEEDEQ